MKTKVDMLHEFVAPYRTLPFKLGEHDCSLFTAKWVEMLTGENLTARFVGKYKTKLGYQRLIKKLGYRDLEDLVCTDFDRVAHRLSNPLSANRGDVVWINGQEEPLCGIVGSNGVYAASSEGLVTLPITNVIFAWRVDVKEFMHG